MSDTSLYRAVLGRVRNDLGQVYHDVNNPLSVISGNIQLLEQLLVMHDADAGILEVVDDIRIACDKMAESSSQLDALRGELSSFLDDSQQSESNEEA